MKWLLALCLIWEGRLMAEDPQVVLREISRSVREVISRSDNYICAEDLSRFYFMTPNAVVACHQPPAVPGKLARVQDRLKLDVAVSNGSEIYSWHGDHRFSAGTVGEVVKEGPISSGSFNGYLRNIFGEKGVQFLYKGRGQMNGVEVYEFDYQVPLSSSHYELQVTGGFVVAPFHGSLSARAETLGLYSLTVTADGEQIPVKSDICAAETRVTYQMVKIASHESLLPASFDLMMGSRTGVFTDSQAKYSGCREYTGESTVHFDMDEDAKQSTTAVEMEREPLKPGVFLPIALKGELDEDTAYAGFPVEAVLTNKVKVKKGEELSRGATLHGVVTRFQIFHDPDHVVSMKIEFSSITDGNKMYLCNAVHDVRPVFQPNYAGGRGRMAQAGSFGRQEVEPGTMLFNSRHVHLDRSFTSMFVTVSQAGDAAQ